MYIIVKNAYGRERFFSIIRQGRLYHEVWVETISLAETFESADAAMEKAAAVKGNVRRQDA